MKPSPPRASWCPAATEHRFTSYTEVELVSLVANCPDAVATLVERELGALASGGNVDATASELFVHKNTVRYRLARAEELLGHSLTQRRTEVDLALRALLWQPH